MNQTGKIQFLNLPEMHIRMEDELLDVFRQAMRTASFIGGTQVEEFENEFARFSGSAHCVGVGSGTRALSLALLAIGLEPGETVLTVPHTFIATCEAILHAGGTFDLVDIDPETCNMDPEQLAIYLKKHCRVDRRTKQLISRRTGTRVRAVIPVHLYGQPADMDAITALAEQYNLVVIEDACQAHGAEYHSAQSGWKRAGSMSTAAAFSFYPGKNLGACGEAGAVTTDDPEIAQKIRMMRDHGQSAKYRHAMLGCNGRLDAIQAGILRVKLQHLEKWNRQRRHRAHVYDVLLSQAEGIQRVKEAENCHSSYHLYVIRTPHRDSLQTFLSQQNIETGLHYPVPVHLQKAFSNRGFQPGDFPVSERVASEVLSLPMHPDLTKEEQQCVCSNLSEFIYEQQRVARAS